MGGENKGALRVKPCSICIINKYKKKKKGLKKKRLIEINRKNEHDHAIVLFILFSSFLFQFPSGEDDPLHLHTPSTYIY